jgi:hypothetical protein
MDQNKCYKCLYRGDVPGDAHSRCNHPDIKQDDNIFGALVGVLMGENKEAISKLNIKGNSYGIANGWFLWPANFDPVWLENCDGFLYDERKL